MPKKSRIIVNNWSPMSDDLAVFYVSQALGLGLRHSEFERINGNRVLVAKFANKSSQSFDVRERDQDGQYIDYDADREGQQS